MEQSIETVRLGAGAKPRKVCYWSRKTALCGWLPAVGGRCVVQKVAGTSRVGSVKRSEEGEPSLAAEARSAWSSHLLGTRPADKPEPACDTDRGSRRGQQTAGSAQNQRPWATRERSRQRRFVAGRAPEQSCAELAASSDYSSRPWCGRRWKNVCCALFYAVGRKDFFFA